MWLQPLISLRFSPLGIKVAVSAFGAAITCSLRLSLAAEL
jgi:hypothetical protein